MRHHANLCATLYGNNPAHERYGGTVKKIAIKLHSAPLHELESCEDTLNQWTNQRLAEGYEIKDLSVREVQSQVLVMAVAMLGQGSHESPDDSAEAQDHIPQPEPPAHPSTGDQDDCQQQDLGLFKQRHTEVPVSELPIDHVGTAWTASRRRPQIRWRRYDGEGTAQVGPKNGGHPGYWWRIIGQGGRTLHKGTALTMEDAMDQCDATMTVPVPI